MNKLVFEFKKMKVPIIKTKIPLNKLGLNLMPDFFKSNNCFFKNHCQTKNPNIQTKSTTLSKIMVPKDLSTGLFLHHIKR
jgi:hypothetical protein